MKRHQEVLAIGLTLLLYAACQEQEVLGDHDPLASDSLGAHQTGPDDNLEFDLLAEEELTFTTDHDLRPGYDYRPQGDLTIECQGCQAGQYVEDFGASCLDNSDCFSGICLALSETQSVCTQACKEECPASWRCQMLPDTAPDYLFACIPATIRLCEPCDEDSDCGFPGDMCLPIGAMGTFCALDCSAGQQCPPDFACKTIRDPNDLEIGKQCIPVTGSCDCSPTLNGKSRQCSLSNQFGTCTGTETCQGALGWQQCNAQVPAQESCNGLDDDCDGKIDEGLVAQQCLVTNQHGSCPGTTQCLGEAGTTCVGTTPAAELCDGLDNNCNGLADESFPDSDNDGVADCTDPDADGDGDPNTTDCRPLDPAIFFGQKESCNGLDDNCNGLVDEGFPDTDGDHLADCVDPDDDSDGVLDDQDCAPLDPALNHLSPELCNAIDDNCNGLFDEGCPATALSVSPVGHAAVISQGQYRLQLRVSAPVGFTNDNSAGLQLTWSTIY